MMTTPVLVFPDLLKAPGQPLHAVIEFAVNEVLGVKVRIRVDSYFRVADDWNVVHPQESLVLRGEYPVSVFSSVPVVGGYPPFPLMRMAALGPPPQQFVEDIVDVGKRLAGTDGLVVVGPAPYLLVQLLNEDLLLPRLAACQNGF